MLDCTGYAACIIDKQDTSSQYVLSRKVSSLYGRQKSSAYRNGLFPYMFPYSSVARLSVPYTEGFSIDGEMFSVQHIEVKGSSIGVYRVQASVLDK